MSAFKNALSSTALRLMDQAGSRSFVSANPSRATIAQGRKAVLHSGPVYLRQ